MTIDLGYDDLIALPRLLTTSRPSSDVRFVWKGQVEVITSVQRRQHWSRVEKEQIVAAAMEPGGSRSIAWGRHAVVNMRFDHLCSVRTRTVIRRPTLTSFTASETSVPIPARVSLVIKLAKATRRGPDRASSSAVSQDGKIKAPPASDG